MQQSLGARFLNIDSSNKRWFILSDAVVLDKIKQALRDKYVPFWAKDLKNKTSSDETTLAIKAIAKQKRAQINDTELKHAAYLLHIVDQPTFTTSLAIYAVSDNKNKARDTAAINFVNKVLCELNKDDNMDTPTARLDTIEKKCFFLWKIVKKLPNLAVKDINTDIRNFRDKELMNIVRLLQLPDSYTKTSTSDYKSIERYIIKKEKEEQSNAPRQSPGYHMIPPPYMHMHMHMHPFHFRPPLPPTPMGYMPYQLPHLPPFSLSQHPPIVPPFYPPLQTGPGPIAKEESNILNFSQLNTKQQPKIGREDNTIDDDKSTPVTATITLDNKQTNDTNSNNELPSRGVRELIDSMEIDDDSPRDALQQRIDALEDALKKERVLRNKETVKRIEHRKSIKILMDENSKLKGTIREQRIEHRKSIQILQQELTKTQGKSTNKEVQLSKQQEHLTKKEGQKRGPYKKKGTTTNKNVDDNNNENNTDAVIVNDIFDGDDIGGNGNVNDDQVRIADVRDNSFDDSNICRETSNDQNNNDNMRKRKKLAAITNEEEDKEEEENNTDSNDSDIDEKIISDGENNRKKNKKTTVATKGGTGKKGATGSATKKVVKKRGPCKKSKNTLENLKELKKLRRQQKEKVVEVQSVFDLAEQNNQRRAKQWVKHYELLKSFKSVHGHCNVPTNYYIDPATGETDGEKKTFCHWVADLRTNHRFLRNGKPNSLTQEKIKLMNDLGFTWQMRIQTHTWDNFFNLLLKWQKEFDTLNVPQYTKQRIYIGLGHWTLYQRKAYREGRLDKEKIARLESIGFKWSLRNRGGTLECRIESRAELIHRVYTWEEQYDRLLTWKREFNHLYVHKRSKQAYLGLAAWVVSQQQLYSEGRLEGYKIQLFENINFPWVNHNHPEDEDIDDNNSTNNDNNANSATSISGNNNIHNSQIAGTGTPAAILQPSIPIQELPPAQLTPLHQYI